MESGTEVGIWISADLTKIKGAAEVMNAGSGAAARRGQPSLQGGPGVGDTLLPSGTSSSISKVVGAAASWAQEDGGYLPRRPASEKRSRSPRAQTRRAHPRTRERGSVRSGSSEGEAAGRPRQTLRLEALLRATHLRVPFSSWNHFI